MKIAAGPKPLKREAGMYDYLSGLIYWLTEIELGDAWYIINIIIITLSWHQRIPLIVILKFDK